MKIFKNASLTEEVQDKILDLGIALAGDTQDYTYYIYNDDDGEVVELSFRIDNTEVEIIEFPKELKSKESGKLVIKYKPSISLKQGLRKEPLHIKGFTIYS